MGSSARPRAAGSVTIICAAAAVGGITGSFFCVVCFLGVSPVLLLRIPHKCVLGVGGGIDCGAGAVPPCRSPYMYTLDLRVIPET